MLDMMASMTADDTLIDNVLPRSSPTSDPGGVPFGVDTRFYPDSDAEYWDCPDTPDGPAAVPQISYLLAEAQVSDVVPPYDTPPEDLSRSESPSQSP